MSVQYLTYDMQTSSVQFYVNNVINADVCVHFMIQ